jgi:hypothetical protein
MPVLDAAAGPAGRDGARRSGSGRQAVLVRGEAYGVVDVLLQGVKARAGARGVRIRALKRHRRLGDQVVERRPQGVAVGDQRDEVRVPDVADKFGVMVAHGGRRTRPGRRPIAAHARRRRGRAKERARHCRSWRLSVSPFAERSQPMPTRRTESPRGWTAPGLAPHAHARATATISSRALRRPRNRGARRRPPVAGRGVERGRRGYAQIVARRGVPRTARLRPVPHQPDPRSDELRRAPRGAVVEPVQPGDSLRVCSGAIQCPLMHAAPGSPC